LNPKPHEAQLEDQKAKKAQEDHLEKEKTAKVTKTQKATNQAKWQKRAKKSSKLSLKHDPPSETNSP
jgi:hypothetical protein